MRPDLADLSLPQLVLVVLVAVGLLTVLVAGSTSSQAFSTFNGAWDGSSSVRAAAADTGGEVEVITDTEPYTTAGPETVAIVLAPTERYSPSERERLRAFVSGGGTLVVAEDVGDGGNRVLSALGVGMRFDGRLVADQRHHGPTAEMPLATNVTDSPYTRDADELMLNHGTVLRNTTNATVVVRTSEFAYLDADEDGAVGDAPLRQSPVVATESVGTGTVVAVSDPSLFINAMQERASNAAFLRGLVGDADRVLLDYTHAGSPPPVQAALLWLRRTPLALAVGGVLGLALVARVSRTGVPTSLPWGDDSQERTPVDERSLLAYVRREHPDWQPDRVRRVIADIVSDEPMTDETDSETNK